MSNVTTLQREQRLVASLAFMLPMLMLSGIATWSVGMEAAYWSQALFLGHAVLGTTCAPLLLAYVGIHFFRTLGNRSFPVFFSGLFTAFIAFAMIGSGLWLVLRGQEESTRWVLGLHIYTALTLVVLGMWHVLLYRRNMRARRRARRSPFPSVDALRRRTMIVGFGVQAVLIGAVGIAGATWGVDELRLPVPETYTEPYGSNPFAPGETRTVRGDLLAESMLVGSDECGGCHVEIYRQWQSSIHRKAALDPAYERTVGALVDGKGIEAARYCEGCHAPAALLSGELTPGGTHGGISGTPANDQGVSCVSCHAITSVRHTKGVGSYEIDAPRSYLFSARDDSWLGWIEDWLRRMRPELHRRNFSEQRISSPEFCAACHVQFMDERLNDWGWLQMQDQYTSWLEGPYSGRRNNEFSHSEVRTCADCHMERLPATDPSASTAGEVRDHRFLGANTFVPSVTGDEGHLRAIQRFLMRDKIRVSIEIEENRQVARSDRYVDEDLRSKIDLPGLFYLGQNVTGMVLVGNVGVGHDFPAGTNDIHEAWVSIRAVDAHGREVFSRGAMSADGKVDDNAHFYRSIKIDRHGKHVWKHDLINMVGEINRNVVPPGESDAVGFDFRIPNWAVGPLSITAQVNYRKFNDRFGAWVMQDTAYRAPVTVLDEDSTTMPLVQRAGAEAP